MHDPGSTTTPSFAAARMAAWQAISDLFLDTRLDEDDIGAIARRLRSTSLAIAELEHIYESEVAPVCAPNLRRVPGGTWAGFSREWLLDAIGRHLQAPGSARRWSRRSWLGRWRIARATASTRSDWARVRRLLIAAGVS